MISVLLLALLSSSCSSPEAAYCIAVSPDGKTVVAGYDHEPPSRGEALRAWISETGTIRWMTEEPAGIECAVFFPDGARIAYAGRDRLKQIGESLRWIDTFGGIKIADSATGATLKFLPTGQDPLCLSHSGKWLASGVIDREYRKYGAIRIWDVATGIEIRTLLGHKESVRALAFTPDDKWIVSGASDRSIRVWDLETGDAVRTLWGHEEDVVCLAISPDGKILATGGLLLQPHSGPTWTVCTLERGSPWTTPNRKKPALHPHQEAPGSLRLWELPSGRPLGTLGGGDGLPLQTRALAFSPDGKTLASGGRDMLLRLWDVKGKKEKMVLKGHRSGITGIAFSMDGLRLYSCADRNDDCIRIWDADSGVQLLVLDPARP